MGSILSRRITYEKRQAGKCWVSEAFAVLNYAKTCLGWLRAAPFTKKANRDLSSLVSRENRQPRIQGICNLVLEGSLSVLAERNRRYHAVVCSRREPFESAHLQFIAIEKHDDQQV